MVSDVAVQSILNNTADAVEEMIEGLVLLNPSLKRLGGHNVVVRASLDRSKVALVSGGGSGHEPSHAGWVGEGMLSAAVCGAVFASPSTAAVLAAILHVTGPAGCLVVVKNYTGDRLNFGLACEHAKALGLSVELVVVGDDCALPHRGLGIAGRRGLAGALLVHKVAGAAAAAGGSLEKVAAEARSTAASLGTVGVALKTCHPFGTLVEERIAAGSMEADLRPPASLPSQSTPLHRLRIGAAGEGAVPWPPSPVLGGLHPQSNSTAVSSPLATFLQLLTGSQQQNRL